MLRILLANFFLGFDSGPAWICSASAGESWCGGWWRWWSWWPEMEVCFRLETNLSSSPLWREDLWLLPAVTQRRENIYLILFEIILFIVLSGLHWWGYLLFLVSHGQIQNVFLCPGSGEADCSGGGGSLAFAPPVIFAHLHFCPLLHHLLLLLLLASSLLPLHVDACSEMIFSHLQKPLQCLRKSPEIIKKFWFQIFYYALWYAILYLQPSHYLIIFSCEDQIWGLKQNLWFLDNTLGSQIIEHPKELLFNLYKIF